MTFKKASARMLNGARLVLAFLATMQIGFFGPLLGSARANDDHTSTPIKHVIIIVGENRTFDHIFATYAPKAGESVNNLLSEKIITSTGAPGTNYLQANQYSANVTGHTKFELSPTAGKAPYSFLRR
jgi:phospholipase C